MRVTAPIGGVVTQTIVEAGELIAPRMPLLSSPIRPRLANVYVGEPDIPRLHTSRRRRLHRYGAGGRYHQRDRRQGEFTPRRQTAEDRSKRSTA
jgi:multidrug resistance efflux pump